MKISLFLLSCFLCLHLLKADKDYKALCEGCLATVKAIERSLKKVPKEKRDGVIDHIMKGRVCRTLQSPQLSKEELSSSCHHLLDSHRDHILTALKANSENTLSISLCYENSKHCIGVKRQSFQASKDPFTDSLLDDLLRENKDNLRVTNPIHPDSKDSPPLKAKDEL